MEVSYGSEHTVEEEYRNSEEMVTEWDWQTGVETPPLRTVKQYNEVLRNLLRVFTNTTFLPNKWHVLHSLWSRTAMM